MRTLLLGILVILVQSGFGQKIENIRIAPKGDSVLITYDLNYFEGETFRLALYSSHDDYNKPLTRVSGDIGENIPSGKDRQVIWLAQKELGEFQDNIKFRFKGGLNIKSLEFKDDPTSKRVKKGKTLYVTWNGGIPEANYQLILHSGGIEVKKWDIDNKREYTLDISQDIKPGKYRLEINTNSDLPNITSGLFTVGRKIPLGLAAVPAAGLGAAIFLLQGGEGGGGNPIPEPEGPE